MMLVKNVAFFTFLMLLLTIIIQVQSATPPEVSPTLYPYHAFVEGHGTFWCSGTLISKDYVLTNGFCVNGSTGVTIYLGYQKNPFYVANRGEPGTLTIEANATIVHPDFAKINDYRYYNNIALIKLSVSATFSSKIQPGLLSTKERNQLLSGRSGDLSSWYEQYLSHALITYSTQDTCKIAFTQYFAQQELCGRWDDYSLVATGIPVKTDGRIVGQRTSAPCPTTGFTCGTYLIVLNFAEFLDWIVQNTNLSYQQLTGEPNQPDCCSRALINQQALAQSLNDLQTSVSTIATRVQRITQLLLLQAPSTPINCTFIG